MCRSTGISPPHVEHIHVRMLIAGSVDPVFQINMILASQTKGIMLEGASFSSLMDLSERHTLRQAMFPRSDYLGAREFQAR